MIENEVQSGRVDDYITPTTNHGDSSEFEVRQFGEKKSYKLHPLKEPFVDIVFSVSSQKICIRHS